MTINQSFHRRCQRSATMTHAAKRKRQDESPEEGLCHLSKHSRIIAPHDSINIMIDSFDIILYILSFVPMYRSLREEWIMELTCAKPNLKIIQILIRHLYGYRPCGSGDLRDIRCLYMDVILVESPIKISSWQEYARLRKRACHLPWRLHLQLGYYYSDISRYYAPWIRKPCVKETVVSKEENGNTQDAAASSTHSINTDNIGNNMEMSNQGSPDNNATSLPPLCKPWIVEIEYCIKEKVIPFDLIRTFHDVTLRLMDEGTLHSNSTTPNLYDAMTMPYDSTLIPR